MGKTSDRLSDKPSKKNRRPYRYACGRHPLDHKCIPSGLEMDYTRHLQPSFHNTGNIYRPVLMVHDNFRKHPLLLGGSTQEMAFYTQGISVQDSLQAFLRSLGSIEARLSFCIPPYYSCRSTQSIGLFCVKSHVCVESPWQNALSAQFRHSAHLALRSILNA